jgi:hypothetical protein
MTMADDLTALLAESQRIADGLQFACRLPDKTPDFTACGGPAAEAYWEHFTPARISSLLAAIRAVLEKAGEWEREFARLEPSGADASGHANPGSYLVSGRLGALEDCTAGLREAITSSLSGDGAVREGGEKKEAGDA